MSDHEVMQVLRQAANAMDSKHLAVRGLLFAIAASVGFENSEELLDEMIHWLRARNPADAFDMAIESDE